MSERRLSEKTKATNRECIDNTDRIEGKKGLILGWGKDDDNEKSDTLREVELTIISNRQCEAAFK